MEPIEVEDPRDTIIMVLAAQIQKDKAEIHFLQSQLQRAYETPVQSQPPLPGPETTTPPPLPPIEIEKETNTDVVIKTPIGDPPQKSHRHDKTLWVWLGGIPMTSYTKTLMWDMFDKYGHVIEVYFHPIKSYAKVRMQTSEQAQRAMKHLDGVKISGYSPRILVKPYRPKF